MDGTGDPLIGSMVGHFRILEQIGAGGMGVVYRAQDLKLPRQVALKFLPEMLAHAPASLERFRREAFAASALNHPNICTIHEIGENHGRAFIVMELMEGVSLRKRIAERSLKVTEVLALGIDVASGLASAHAKGIIHRDIKPANIFVTAEGHAKILDFGLAKVLPAQMKAVAADSTAELSLTFPGATVGTVAYMSPEQARGEELDARTDLFSFGATLYEMATGTRAFQGKSLAELHDAILNHHPEPLTHTASSRIPPKVEEIILKCLEKDPAHRYQTAKEIAVDLRRLTMLSPAPHHSAPTLKPALKMSRLVSLAIAALVLLAIAGSVLLLREPRKEAGGSIASIAVLPFANLSSDANQQYFSDGLAEELMNQLSKISGLKVAGRTSSFKFSTRDNDLKEIGDKLHVTNVLEGSVRQQGSRVRITAKLLKVDDGFDIWSESYDRELNDIFAVQSDIANAVARALQVKLLGNGNSQFQPHVTNPEAYNAYLLGKFFNGDRQREHVERAVSYLQRATSLDPNLSLAWVELSRAYATQAGMGYGPHAEGYEKARAAGQTALALDPDSGKAYEALATIQTLYDWNWEGAKASYEKALSLAPEDPEIAQDAAIIFRILGHLDKSLALLHQAESADPLNALTHTQLGDTYTIMERYDEAEREYDKVIELNPNFGLAHCNRGRLYLLRGRTAQAISEIQQEKVEWCRLYTLAAALYAAGKLRRSDEELAQMIAANEYAGPFQIAAAYAYRGDADQAFFWLQRAYERRDGGIAEMRTSPLMKGIRNDPRFAAMLKKLGLPQ